MMGWSMGKQRLVQDGPLAVIGRVTTPLRLRGVITYNPSYPFIRPFTVAQNSIYNDRRGLSWAKTTVFCFVKIHSSKQRLRQEPGADDVMFPDMVYPPQSRLVDSLPFGSNMVQICLKVYNYTYIYIPPEKKLEASENCAFRRCLMRLHQSRAF